MTLSPGTRTLQLCVSDDAGNTACADWSVNADPAAPDAVAGLNAQINDARSTDVELIFTAPGDDGAAGGPVQQFAIRRSDAPIDNETAWQNAAASELIVAATVAPGGQETVSIVGVGPDPASQPDYSKTLNISLRYALWTTPAEWVQSPRSRLI